MKRLAMGILAAATVLVLAGGPALAQVLPGATVEERAINGAKAYIKKHNLKNPTLTVLQNALFKNAQPEYDRQWEKLTGVKVKSIPYGYTDIPSKIMAEAVAKTGQWDIFNHFPYSIPDAWGAGVIRSLDAYAKKGKPDFSGIESGLRAQQWYQGNLTFLLLDGDHLALVIRKDIADLAKNDYKAKFGKEPGCPETMSEWEQMAKYFHTEKGQTRWGKKFDKPLYGALAYRSINFSYRHFPAYFGGLLFDKNMNPRINTPQGVTAIQGFASIVKYMPPDVQGWGTPQIYPFWGSGQAFSVMSFPSIVGYGNKNPKSTIKDQQITCMVPGVKVKGKLVRRSPQAAGAGWAVSRYSKHPELAYYFLQWLTAPTKGDELIADPKGFWDPMRKSNLTAPAVVSKFGKQMIETTLANAKVATSLLMIEGNYEYFNVLDKNLSLVMQGNISAKEAAKRIESGWNKITKDVGRKNQVRAWRKGVASGAYIDKF
ncbi:MAG: extracellular solute-binding protein [bacterium]|nr:extracellular solute-binding protein [bacterium]